MNQPKIVYDCRKNSKYLKENKQALNDVDRCHYKENVQGQDFECLKSKIPDLLYCKIV